MKALGMIETRGMVGTIEAVDVACKTADVEVLNRHFVKGGIVTVEIVGDVGAVKVAIEAAAEAVKRLGVYIGSHVIPRPAQEVYSMLEKKGTLTEEKIEEEIAREIVEELSEDSEMLIEEVINEIADEIEIKTVTHRKDKNKK